MEHHECKIGMRVNYFLRKDRSLPGTIVNITTRRIVIRLDMGGAHRNTLADSLSPLDETSNAQG